MDWLWQTALGIYAGVIPALWLTCVLVASPEGRRVGPLRAAGYAVIWPALFVYELTHGRA